MNYAQKMEEAKRRRAEIVRLFKQKNPVLSMREIGLRLDPQITPQRVGQLLAKEKATR